MISLIIFAEGIIEIPQATAQQKQIIHMMSYHFDNVGIISYEHNKLEQINNPILNYPLDIDITFCHLSEEIIHLPFKPSHILTRFDHPITFSRLIEKGTIIITPSDSLTSHQYYNVRSDNPLLHTWLILNKGSLNKKTSE